MPGGEPEADGTAKVLHVQREPGNSERIKELADDIGEAVEGIREGFPVGCVAISEAGVIGREDVKIVVKAIHQVTEHEGRSQESHEAERALAGHDAQPLPIEDIHAVDIDFSVVRHDASRARWISICSD